MATRLYCFLGIHNFDQYSVNPLHPSDPNDPRLVYIYECLDCGTKRGEVR